MTQMKFIRYVLPSEQDIPLIMQAVIDTEAERVLSRVISERHPARTWRVAADVQAVLDTIAEYPEWEKTDEALVEVPDYLVTDMQTLQIEQQSVTWLSRSNPFGETQPWGLPNKS